MATCVFDLTAPDQSGLPIEFKPASLVTAGDYPGDVTNPGCSTFLRFRDSRASRRMTVPPSPQSLEARRVRSGSLCRPSRGGASPGAGSESGGITLVTLIVRPQLPPLDPQDPRTARIRAVLRAAQAQGRPRVQARMCACSSLELPFQMLDFTVSRHREGPKPAEILRKNVAGIASRATRDILPKSRHFRVAHPCRRTACGSGGGGLESHGSPDVCRCPERAPVSLCSPKRSPAHRDCQERQHPVPGQRRRHR